MHRRAREAEALAAQAELDQAVVEGRGINREEMQRRIKELFDPAGILNPGKAI